MLLDNCRGKKSCIFFPDEQVSKIHSILSYNSIATICLWWDVKLPRSHMFVSKEHEKVIPEYEQEEMVLGHHK